MLIGILLIVYVYTYSFERDNNLINHQQSHLILANSYYKFVFSVTNLIKNQYQQAEIDVEINLFDLEINPNNNGSFDFITFPDIYSQSQYKCYEDSISLGLYNLSNCSIQCNSCNESCISGCFNNIGTCCCSECQQYNYTIKAIANQQLSQIINQQVLVVIDNSNMFSSSPKQLSNLTLNIEYAININVNKEYEITTYTTIGISIFLIILMIVICVCLNQRLSLTQLKIKELEADTLKFINTSPKKNELKSA